MTGLSTHEVEASRKQHGTNSLELKKDRLLINVLREIILEPMFLLLLAACFIYFLSQQHQEGIIMLISLFLVAGISLFQEYRSRNAVSALRKLSGSKAMVIRDGIEQRIHTDDLVVDDVLILEEGDIIPADALAIECRDMTVNESTLTGEAVAVTKQKDDELFRGTLVTSGRAISRVSAVGKNTSFGKIADAVQEIQTVKTPLQQQISSFVRYMVLFGAIAFALVVILNYVKSGQLLQAIMQGLTLAMSILPEEIPVAFSTFQALGAFRLLRQQIIVKQPQFVETLGSATVICADKTGTLTENNMEVACFFDPVSQNILPANSPDLPEELLSYAMWSSETKPFDPMEIAIHEHYTSSGTQDLRNQFTQIHEYPIGGQPPMMTHVFRNHANTQTIIAAKGAPERMIRICGLTDQEGRNVLEKTQEFARKGLRVLGVAKGHWPENQAWPEEQDAFEWHFLGLIAFQDPPKKDIAKTISTFHEAGISVRMITGDHPETALAIAGQIGLPAGSDILTGKQIAALSAEELRSRISTVTIFARMFPDAKLRIIEALKSNGEVVAMTGDGVNDAPALKAAHIGIAMGKRGSEVAKNAASLILTDDNLSHMTDAVALGRKIYDNLKKAIQYIVSIHIPIIMVVALPLLLGWEFTDIFSPIHVIFMELIMGPTCSIIYENEPMEPGTMNRPPRLMGRTFLSWRQLTLSIIQGLVITAGCLTIGYIALSQQKDHQTVRTMIFLTLLFSNIWLTLTNRSFYHSLFTTLTYRNRLLPVVLLITLTFILMLLNMSALQSLFKTSPLSSLQLISCLLVAAASTLWIEIIKWMSRIRTRRLLKK